MDSLDSEDGLQTGLDEHERIRLTSDQITLVADALRKPAKGFDDSLLGLPAVKEELDKADDLEHEHTLAKVQALSAVAERGQVRIIVALTSLIERRASARNGAIEQLVRVLEQSDERALIAIRSSIEESDARVKRAA